MNKKGSLSGLAFFVGFLIVIILVAPLILKVGITTLDRTATALYNVQSSNQSSNEVTYVRNQLTGTFDWLVMIFILLNVLLLLISAFLIDVHPAFLIVYILGAFALVISLPYGAAAAEKIYGMAEFAQGTDNPVQYLQMTQFVLNNFGIFIAGVFFLTGVIMYAKIRFGSQLAGGQSY